MAGSGGDCERGCLRRRAAGRPRLLRAPRGGDRHRRPARRAGPRVPGRPPRRPAPARHRDGRGRRRGRPLPPPPPPPADGARGCRREGRRRHPRRQLPPALRPLRRQPAARRPSGVRAARRARGRACSPTTRCPSSVDAPGLRYEELDGEAEVAAGRARRADAGTHGRAPVGRRQARRRCRDRPGRPEPRHRLRLQRRRPLPGAPRSRAIPSRCRCRRPWLDRLQALDPAAVYFAHDHAVWQP